MIEDILHGIVFKREEFLAGDVTAALNKAFEEADRIVVADSIEKNYMNGCTAVVGVIFDGTLYIANIGDSEAILVSVDGDKVSAENLTFPHKASVASEKSRIESLGGYVFFNRVFGSLAVTRAFGDSRYKQPKTNQNFVSYIPNTKTVPLITSHRYLLLACDGLWDVCTHEEVAKIVHQQFEQGKSSEEVASFLCSEALRKKSEDNVTVVVTKIDWDGICTSEKKVETTKECESTQEESQKSDENQQPDTLQTGEEKKQVMDVEAEGETNEKK